MSRSYFEGAIERVAIDADFYWTCWLQETDVMRRLARQSDRDEKDMQQVRVIEERDGRVFTSTGSVMRI